MLENEGFFQNQPIGQMVFCFNYYIPWMHYERLYLVTCWKISYTISLLAFFLRGMAEPLDHSGPHHPLLGCTAYYILVSKLQCSCPSVLYCHEQGYEWHFINIIPLHSAATDSPFTSFLNFTNSETCYLFWWDYTEVNCNNYPPTRGSTILEQFWSSADCLAHQC